MILKLQNVSWKIWVGNAVLKIVYRTLLQLLILRLVNQLRILLLLEETLKT